MGWRAGQRWGARRGSLALLLAAGLLGGCDLLPFQWSSGEHLYRKHCVRCHGVHGGGTVRVISSPYADLRDDDFKYGHGSGDMARVIRDGVFGEMPSYDEKLSPEEIEAIVEHVEELRRKFGTRY